MIKYIDIDLYKCRDNEKDDKKVLEMPINFQQYYLSLYSLYSSMFMEYLKKNTIIKEVDDELTNSDLRFKSIEEKDKDFYQYLSDLNYFYVRNNCYLQRLTFEESEFLKNRIIVNNYIFDDEMENFIKNTFKRVIFENPRTTHANFGPFNSNFFAPVNSLVLGVRYNDMEMYEMTEDEWYDNLKKQKISLQDVSSKLLKNINEILNLNCTIFEYNEFTVRRKNRQFEKNK